MTARHPETSAWTDYVRALVTDDERVALQRHLDDGCRPCRATVAALEQVMTTAEIDGAIEPPSGAIRSAKAFFDVQHPGTRKSWTELALRRAFDSARTPAMASRSLSPTVRQMLFESDEYTLELSVDYSPGTVDAVLRGQILEAQGEPRSHTPVLLVGGGEVVGRAISQRHGDFQMSGPLDLTSELWVIPDDRNRIRLTLKPDN